MDKQPVPGAEPGPSPTEPGVSPAEPGAAPEEPGPSPEEQADEPRASRVTTALLSIALVLVVVITGALGAVAVVMTRNPDMLPGGALPHKLAIPIHFAPVTGVQPAPCPGVEAILDEAGTTCYLVAAGISVTAVQKIESIREQSGSYAVRVALPSPFREQVGALTEEAIRERIAVVVGERVVTAPRVAQAVTADSLSISGSFTKEVADSLVARLLGSGGTAPPTTAAPPSTGPTGVETGPATSPPTGTVGTQPPAIGADTAGPSTPAGATASTGAPANTAAIGNPQTEGLDPRYSSCKEVTDNGYGPYYKESHPEYTFYPDADRDGVACDSDELR